MKSTTSKLIVISTLLLAVCSLVSPVRADEKADRKAAREQKKLEKYDKNHDGKLDDEENAAMEADKAKHRRKKAADKSETPAAGEPQH